MLEAPAQFCVGSFSKKSKTINVKKIISLLPLMLIALMMFLSSCEKVYEDTTIYTSSSQLYLMSTPTPSGEEKDFSVLFYAINESDEEKGVTIDTCNVSYNAVSKKWTTDLGKLSGKYTMVHSAFDRADSIAVTCEGKTVSVRGYTYGEKRLLEIAFNQKTENGLFGVEEHNLELEERIIIIE